jgi:hypothetical protein
LLQPLQERRDAGLPFRVICGRAQERADAPHAVCLLRARDERPCRSRATSKRDELAPPHA